MSATPEFEEEFKEFVRYHRENTLKAMSDSAFVTSIVPSGEADVKFAVELGLAIMLEKPIMLVAMPGVRIPPKLRELADEIVEDVDLELEEGRMAISRAILHMMARIERGTDG